MGSEMVPQAIEIAQNGLGNGDPPARGRWEAESIRRMPYTCRGPSSSQFRAQPFQITIAHADLPEVIVGLKDIFRIAAELSLAGAHVFEHRLAIETPRILVVEPVGNISHSKDAVAAFERHRRNPLEIDRGHLLAFPKV